MSKTNHPRLPGTHRAGHALREAREALAVVRAQRAIAEREAIDESLTERLYVDIDVDALAVGPTRAEIDEAYELNDLAAWERTLLLNYADSSYVTLRRAEHEALEDEIGFDPFEDDNDALVEDDWRSYATQEARDAALAEERAWIADREAEYARTYGDPADEDDLDSEEHPSAWLTGDPREFFDALGDAWVIEGPSMSKPSVRAAGYMRVYELAQQVGITSAAMVRHLCRTGEHVASHTAYVALPIADIALGMAEHLRGAYGLRPDAERRAQQQRLDDLRRRLTNPITGEIVRPPAPRPGAPRPGVVPARPGRNPFLTIR